MIVGYLFFISRSLYVLKIIWTKIVSISSIFEILLPFATSFHFMEIDVLEEANTPQPVVHGSDGRME